MLLQVFVHFNASVQPPCPSCSETISLDRPLRLLLIGFRIFNPDDGFTEVHCADGRDCGTLPTITTTTVSNLIPHHIDESLPLLSLDGKFSAPIYAFYREKIRSRNNSAKTQNHPRFLAFADRDVTFSTTTTLLLLLDSSSLSGASTTADKAELEQNFTN